MKSGISNVEESEDFYYYRKDEKSKKISVTKTSRKKMKGEDDPPASSKKSSRYTRVVQPPLWASKPPEFFEENGPSAATSKTGVTSRRQLDKVSITSGQLSKKYVDDWNNFLKFLKIKAEEYNNSKQYKELVDLYSEAIYRMPTNPDFYCNRSYGYFKLEYYGQAVLDANEAIKLDPLYMRAYYRRAAGFVGLGQLLSALQDYDRLQKLCPKSGRIKCLRSQCQSAVNRLLFDLTVEDNLSEHYFDDMIDYTTIEYETGYVGPKLAPTGHIGNNFLWELIRLFRRDGRLHRRVVYRLLFDSKKILQLMPTLVEIELNTDQDRLNVIGDVQGQIMDLIHVVEINGLPSAKNRFLFNGNIIGKGAAGLETMILVLAFKVAFPNKCFIARGHQESLLMTRMFGFEQQVKEKYGPAVYELFIELFKLFPLAHLINKRVLVIHGGLFSDPEIVLASINETFRCVEPSESSIMRDILFSDPKDTPGREDNYRGMGGILFGPDVTLEFLQNNELDYIIRSHGYVGTGYKTEHEDKLITVFSASNYCDAYENMGCCIRLTGKALEMKVIKIDPTKNFFRRPFHYADSIFHPLFQRKDEEEEEEENK